MATDRAVEGVLLACPFCGPGNSMVDPWFDDVSKRWRVGCGRCGSSTGTSVHAEGSKEKASETTAAYQRGAKLEKRRGLMKDWGSYVAAPALNAAMLRSA